MANEVETYVPLKGEGDVQVVVKTRLRHECEKCGEPATKRIIFCYRNGRHNPASSMYGKDDCSYCVDASKYCCADCERFVESDAPDGMVWGGASWRDYDLLYWYERPANAAELAAIVRAEAV